MSINGSVLNTQVVNGPDTRFFGQAGLLISIEQEIELEELFSGEVISFEQNIESTNSGLVITFEQFVRNNSIPDFLTRNGFKPRVTLGGWTIPDTQLAGTHRIVRAEDEASILEFEILPPAGVQDVYFYEGKTVTYDIIRPYGTTRIYTGRVNIVDFDLINQRVRINCTDNREELINAQLSGFMSNIGYYNELVQGKALSVYDEVTKRLSTVPYSLEFNAYGQFTYTPWAAKATADYIFDGNDVYYRKPQVIFASRQRITNQINLSFQYRFPRLFHGEISYIWSAPYGVCEFLTKGYTMTSRAMVQAAAESAGWKINGAIGYTDFFRDGFYNCGGVKIGWSNTETVYKTIPKQETNAQGVLTNVLDSSGAQVYTGAPVAAIDHSLEYCLSAGWVASQQWAQTVTQNYNLTIVAPQSQAQYGVVEQNQTASVDTNFDTSEWEAYDNVETGTPGNYFVDSEPNLGDFYNGSAAAISAAYKTILAAHRDTRVVFETQGAEFLDLTHTIEVDTVPVYCQGKIERIEHMIDVNSLGEFTTEVTVAISRASGSASGDAPIAPTKITDSPTVDIDSIALDSHYGLAPRPEWTGMIGNKFVTEFTGGISTNTYKTNYPVQFVVDTPAIPDQYRVERTLEASQTYNVEIPIDPLIITF